MLTWYGNCCVFGFTFVLVHVVVAPDTDFTIRKCCPKGARLLATAKVRCTTMSAQVSDNVTRTAKESEYDWIPRPLEGVDGHEAELDTSRLKVAYGLGPKCGDGERFRTTLYYNAAADYAFKLFAHNGSLVEIKRFGEQTWRMGYFSSKSFCVDSVRDPDYTHAAKVCFCVEKLCILKCCGYGTYLNTGKNICLPNKNTLPNYLPVLYDIDLLPLANTPSDVYFMSALPRCKPRGFDVLNGVDQTATSAFFVQSNGNVVLIDDKSNRTVTALNYCVDMFQTDDESVGPNLAVCQNTKDAIKRAAPVARSVKVKTDVGSNRSSSSTVSCSPLLLTLSIFRLSRKRSFI